MGNKLSMIRIQFYFRHQGNLIPVVKKTSFQPYVITLVPPTPIPVQKARFENTKSIVDDAVHSLDSKTSPDEYQVKKVIYSREISGTSFLDKRTMVDINILFLSKTKLDGFLKRSTAKKKSRKQTKKSQKMSKDGFLITINYDETSEMIKLDTPKKNMTSKLLSNLPKAIDVAKSLSSSLSSLQ